MHKEDLDKGDIHEGVGLLLKKPIDLFLSENNEIKHKYTNCIHCTYNI